VAADSLWPGPTEAETTPEPPKKDKNSPVPTDDAKSAVTLPGTVETIIPSPDPREPERVQIGVHGADDLYREIRVENLLKDATGEDVSLKQGADVNVTIEAEKEATQPTKSSQASVSKASKDDNKRK
jgi:hypothetical protein